MKLCDVPMRFRLVKLLNCTYLRHLVGFQLRKYRLERTSSMSIFIQKRERIAVGIMSIEWVQSYICNY
jgi:hypothetical protein